MITINIRDGLRRHIGNKTQRDQYNVMLMHQHVVVTELSCFVTQKFKNSSNNSPIIGVLLVDVHSKGNFYNGIRSKRIVGI